MTALFEAYRSLRRGNRALRQELALFEGSPWNVSSAGVSRAVKGHTMLVRPGETGAEILISYPDGHSKTYVS